MAVGADEVARAVAVRICVAVVVWRFQRRDSRERDWRRDGGMDRGGSRGNASVIGWEGSSRYGKQGGVVVSAYRVSHYRYSVIIILLRLARFFLRQKGLECAYIYN